MYTSTRYSNSQQVEYTAVLNGQFLFASFQQVPGTDSCTVGGKRIVDHVVRILRVRVFVAALHLVDRIEATTRAVAVFGATVAAASRGRLGQPPQMLQLGHVDARNARQRHVPRAKVAPPRPLNQKIEQLKDDHIICVLRLPDRGTEKIVGKVKEHRY